MNYPYYAAMSICITPNATAHITVHTVTRSEDGAVHNTVKRHIYTQEQFDPFTQMTREQVKVLIAAEYNTTVDNVRV